MEWEDKNLEGQECSIVKLGIWLNMEDIDYKTQSQLKTEDLSERGHWLPVLHALETCHS